MLNRGLLFFVSFFLIACSLNSEEKNAETEQKTEIDKNWELDWIIGEFIDSTTFKGRTVYVESWVKSSESLYSGKKYSIKKGDTLSPTLISINKTDNKFYYSYYVDKHQVTFVQDSISDYFISFRNTTNVFPDQLVYTHIKDTMMISFSGIQNGLKMGSSFKTIRKNTSLNNQ